MILKKNTKNGMKMSVMKKINAMMTMTMMTTATITIIPVLEDKIPSNLSYS